MGFLIANHVIFRAVADVIHLVAAVHVQRCARNGHNATVASNSKKAAARSTLSGGAEAHAGR